MRAKDITNTGAIAVGSFSILGWLLPSVAKWIGWVEWAQGLSAVFALFSDPRISWPGIYVLLSMGAATLFAVNNWSEVRVWLARRKELKDHRWDISITEAAMHVAVGTYFGDALKFEDIVQKASHCLQAVWEAARAGKLPLGASAPGIATPDAISRRELRDLFLTFKTMPSPRYSYGPVIFDVRIVRPADKTKVVYDKIFTDRAALDRLWRRSPQKF